MNKKIIKLTLPYPVSTNVYYRHAIVGRGKMAHAVTYLSVEGKVYKERVAVICRAERVEPFPIDVEVALTMRFYRPRKSGDLSNRIKCLEDSLEGLAFINDSQVGELVAFRFEDKTDPRVEVEIEER